MLSNFHPPRYTQAVINRGGGDTPATGVLTPSQPGYPVAGERVLPAPLTLLSPLHRAMEDCRVVEWALPFASVSQVSHRGSYWLAPGSARRLPFQQQIGFVGLKTGLSQSPLLRLGYNFHTGNRLNKCVCVWRVEHKVESEKKEDECGLTGAGLKTA